MLIHGEYNMKKKIINGIPVYVFDIGWEEDKGTKAIIVLKTIEFDEANSTHLKNEGNKLMSLLYKDNLNNESYTSYRFRSGMEEVF